MVIVSFNWTLQCFPEVFQKQVLPEAATGGVI